MKVNQTELTYDDSNLTNWVIKKMLENNTVGKLQTLMQRKE